MRGPSPLLGYNTNVRHKGKLYHIQTEDSGINHPHIITHLFADGGRIIASKKTAYAQYVGSEKLQEIVKKLMQEQHKAMFIALRDCVYDEEEDGATAPANGSAAAARAGDGDGSAQTVDGSGAADGSAAEVRGGGAEASAQAPRSAAPASIDKKPEPPPEVKAPELDLDALERAAEAKIAQSAAAKVRSDARKRGVGRYKQTVPAESKRPERPSKMPDPQASIFNGQVLRSKSLDEVILSYLADDSSDDK
jgi:hypothetical protein